MFEYIYDWIWNLVSYMILVTALIQALPENSYQKYLRFFYGLILILLLVTPIFRVFGMEEQWDLFYQKAEYRRMLREMEEASEMFGKAEQEFWKEGEK